MPSNTIKTLFAAAVALALLIPAEAAHAAPADSDKTQGAKPKTKITVKKRSRGKGYGFLPGYPPAERERRRPEMRFYSWDGRAYYGWGGPGFYRGQYNGGSMGPCWTSTPIGMIWNCGR